VTVTPLGRHNIFLIIAVCRRGVSSARVATFDVRSRLSQVWITRDVDARRQFPRDLADRAIPRDNVDSCPRWCWFCERLWQRTGRPGRASAMKPTKAVSSITRLSRRGPLGLAVVLTCAALCVLGVGRTSAPTAVFDQVTTSSQPPPTLTWADPPPFRLGTAAKPFGWSTAIADFDRDGRPDVAVADHLGRHDGAYAYRIEFLLAGRPSAAVVFESTADAVTIQTVDVDHDDDLDIVVGRALGGDAVGVWLNDGRGHFTAADSNALPSVLHAADTLTSSDPSLDPVTLGSLSRRGHDAAAAAHWRAPSDARSGPVARSRGSRYSQPSHLLLRPRGPPPVPARS
jgi:FG-GAP repeat